MDGYLTHLLLLKGEYRDLSWIAIGVVTEIRRAESDRNSNNAAIFYGYPYLTFYLEEFFCAHLFPFFL